MTKHHEIDTHYYIVLLKHCHITTWSNTHTSKLLVIHCFVWTGVICIDRINWMWTKNLTNKQQRRYLSVRHFRSLKIKKKTNWVQVLLLKINVWTSNVGLDRVQTNTNYLAEYGFIRKRIIPFCIKRIPYWIIRLRLKTKRICIFNIRLKP